MDCNLSSCQIELDHDFSEVMFVKININNNDTLTLGAFYRSPSSSKANDNELFTLLDKLKDVIRDKLLLIGDFNMPNINWSNCTTNNDFNANSSANKFITCLNNNYLTQNVLFPTRARGTQTPHILDLIISNGEFIEEFIISVLLVRVTIQFYIVSANYLTRIW